jgi:hypothetical protein
MTTEKLILDPIQIRKELMQKREAKSTDGTIKAKEFIVSARHAFTQDSRMQDVEARPTAEQLTKITALLMDAAVEKEIAYRKEVNGRPSYAPGATSTETSKKVAAWNAFLLYSGAAFERNVARQIEARNA